MIKGVIQYQISDMINHKYQKETLSITMFIVYTMCMHVDVCVHFQPSNFLSRDYIVFVTVSLFD